MNWCIKGLIHSGFTCPKKKSTSHHRQSKIWRLSVVRDCFLGGGGCCNRRFLWNANRAVAWAQLQHDGHAVTGSIKKKNKKNWRAHSSVIIFKQAMWKMIMSVLSPSWWSPTKWNTVTLIKIVAEFMQILDGWLEELINQLYLSDAGLYSRPTVFNIWLVHWLK